MKLHIGISFFICCWLLGNQAYGQSISISISKGNTELSSGIANGSGFLQFKNYNLFEVYRMLLAEQKISLEKPTDVIVKTENVNVILRTDSLLFEDGKIMLMDSLLKKYNQKVRYKNKVEDRWVLSVDDAKKLATFVTQNLIPGMVQSKSFNGSELSVVNMSIPEIIAAIEDLIKTPIENHIYDQIDQKYSMDIKLNPIASLTQQFKLKGLRYIQQPTEIRIAVIE
jgi:hypothetical protein